MKYTRLGELLSGSFNDILRTAGIQIGIDKLNNLRFQCEQLGTHLERLVHNKSIEVAKKLQEATSSGFSAFEQEIDRLDARIDALEKKSKKTTRRKGYGPK